MVSLTTPIPTSCGTSILQHSERAPVCPPARADVERADISGDSWLRIGFQRGVQVGAADVHLFLAGELDDYRIADLLAGLLTVDWSGTPDVVFRYRRQPPDPALDLLLPFTGIGPIRLPDAALVRPGPEWPALLQAGHTPGKPRPSW
jgi:hypothetical protein